MRVTRAGAFVAAPQVGSTPKEGGSVKKNGLGRLVSAVSAVFPLLTCALTPFAAAQAPRYWSAWNHHKSVEVLGKEWVADQVDYPIRIVCHKGSGADDRENVFLGNDVRDDFGDIRFRAGKAQPLDYWMETSQTGKTAAFWVKVPRIPRNGVARVKVWYGRPDARTASDGKKTFLFFDDFLGDYEGAGHKNLPAGWESTYKDGNNCDWIVKDGLIRFRGSGHLTTAKKVWPRPATESYTLRCRAKWPKPAFVNPQENGLCFGGVSFAVTDGNAWMNLFALYQKGTLWNGRIIASFGSMPSPTEKEVENLTAYLGAHCLEFELKPFTKAEHGSFLTFEIERRPDETINRVIDTGEEVRSKLVIPGDLHLMMHGCDRSFPNSAYLSVDWMLLRKQAYPNPSYSKWK
jgi:hypothetical protein